MQEATTRRTFNRAVASPLSVTAFPARFPGEVQTIRIIQGLQFRAATEPAAANGPLFSCLAVHKSRNPNSRFDSTTSHFRASWVCGTCRNWGYREAWSTVATSDAAFCRRRPFRVESVAGILRQFHQRGHGCESHPLHGSRCWALP